MATADSVRTEDEGSPGRRRLKRLAAVIVIFAVLAAMVARFGAHLIVASDPLPLHADAAIVLGGGDVSMMARFGEAARLLESGKVDHLMMMVATIHRWGEWMPDVVRRYVARELPADAAGKVVICEGLADSTFREARVLQRCLGATDWESIVVVTSDFHTRRARLIWNAVLAREGPQVSMTVHGVSDGGFEFRGWWRERVYAKTWIIEVTKLAWYFLESMNPQSGEEPSGGSNFYR